MKNIILIFTTLCLVMSFICKAKTKQTELKPSSTNALLDVTVTKE